MIPIKSLVRFHSVISFGWSIKKITLVPNLLCDICAKDGSGFWITDLKLSFASLRIVADWDTVMSTDIKKDWLSATFCSLERKKNFLEWALKKLY